MTQPGGVARQHEQLTVHALLQRCDRLPAWQTQPAAYMLCCRHLTAGRAGAAAKPKRPEHKFQKKAARTKGSRGLQRDEAAYDGGALSVGRRGGLVRVST